MMRHDFENLLKNAIGLDPASVGSTSIERAVQTRMDALGMRDTAGYWQRLTESEAELQELIEAVVVPETWFFRDREAFNALVRLASDEWLPAHRNHEVLRLLSIPCSTGEEPYSIAMALLDAGFPADRFQIDAADVSLRALSAAMTGWYGNNSFRGDNLSFRDHYFLPVQGGYSMTESLRVKVDFRCENVLSEHFRFGREHYDVIFCRNLLIYFDRPTQERVMRTLGNLLRDSAYLFVGPAEAFLASCSGYVSVNRAMSFAFRRAPNKRNETWAASPLSTRDHSVRQPKRAAKTASVPPPHPVAPVVTSLKPAMDLEKARQLADEGLFQEAIEACEDNMRQNGPSSEAYYLLGLLRDAIRDRSGAGECYKKAVYLEPGHAEALLHLALVIESDGDVAAANRLRERARRSGSAKFQPEVPAKANSEVG